MCKLLINLPVNGKIYKSLLYKYINYNVSVRGNDELGKKNRARYLSPFTSFFFNYFEL